MSTPAAGTTTAPGVPQWTFADRMRKVRFDVLGLHQAELAEKLGVTKAAYAAWESGRTTPRDILAVARRVELLSGVPASWLLGLNSPSNVARRGLRLVRSAQVTDTTSEHAATPIAQQGASQGADLDSAA